MVESCGAKVLKCFLFAFNFVFFLAGAAALGVGIWLIVDQNAAAKVAFVSDTSVDLEKQQPQVIRDLGILLAVGGGIIFVISFFGCCGAIKEWRLLLGIYAVFLLIILAIEAAAAIYGGIKKDTVEQQIQSGLRKSLQRFYGNETNGFSAAWDKIMKEYKCCGVTGNETDFSGTPWRAANPKTPFPNVCCSNAQCTNTSQTGTSVRSSNSTGRPPNLFEQGCYDAVKSALSTQFIILIAVAAGVAGIQIIGAIFAICLCQAIRSEEIA